MHGKTPTLRDGPFDPEKPPEFLWIKNREHQLDFVGNAVEACEHASALTKYARIVYLAGDCVGVYVR